MIFFLLRVDYQSAKFILEKDAKNLALKQVFENLASKQIFAKWQPILPIFDFEIKFEYL